MKSTTVNTGVILLTMLLLGFSVCAQERVSDDRETLPNGTLPISTRDAESEGAPGTQPTYRVSAALEMMSALERANSLIEITAIGSDDPKVLSAMRDAQSLWNQYESEKAIALLRQLEDTNPGLSFEVVNVWRVPVAGDDDSRFGADVRIGGRDSVEASCLDIDRASGHLFAALRLLGDLYQSRIGFYFSSNGGATWVETAILSHATYTYPSFSIAVVDDHCYLSYVLDSLVGIRQFKVSNGAIDTLSTGSYVYYLAPVTPPVKVSEVCLVSNQDFVGFSDRLYLSMLTSSNELLYYWDDPGAVSWTKIVTGITDAEAGLSMSVNEGYSDYYVLLSYENVNDSLYVYGRKSTGFDMLLRRPMGASAYVTSIGAYQDTIHCFYEYNSTVLQNRYQVSYNGGTSWSWGVVDDTTFITEYPSITARDGGGVGITYRINTSPRASRFTWRRYTGWPWPTPQLVSDYQTYPGRSSIEYLGSGIYGIVYRCWTEPFIRAAYFDRGSGCCTGMMGNIDGSEDGLVTMGDLTVLIDHLFITLTPLACPLAANVDLSADGLITMGDLTVLIDHLFITLTPLPACP
jgi:hypothetical protein